MTSKIKVDNIENQCGGAVVTKCGATTTISGSVVKADDIQAADGGNLINQCGTTITLGASGDTINLASGASQSGFGRTGTVDWDTTPKTATFTAVSGNGYFCNTSGGAFTVNLPAGSAGNIVSLADYAATWQTNNLTVSPNGTEKIGSVNADAVLSTEGQSVTFVYVDGTQGWINTMDSTSNARGILTYNVQYLVVAGGGGGGGSTAGGGGAGGYRTLSSKTFPVASGDSFPITVGGGGGPGTPPSPIGVSGSNSVFSTITSAGGGGGGSSGSPAGLAGGSGGGGGANKPAGTGNTPPVSPPQGNNGAPITPPSYGGGGGGAGGIGVSDNGGIGSSFTDLGPLAPSYGTTGPAPGRYFSGGGGGYISGAGGSGGGSPYPGNGTPNTGGGGSATGTGGSGIVIIRHVTADASPSVSGGNSTTTCGSDTIRVFTGPGTFVS